MVLIFLFFAFVASVAGVFYPANDPNILISGRSTVNNTLLAVEFDWSGVEITFNIEQCSYFIFDLQDNQNVYNVLSEAGSVSVIATKPSQTQYHIPFKTDSPTTITITKRTEAFFGVVSFFGIHTDGYISKPSKPSQILNLGFNPLRSTTREKDRIHRRLDHLWVRRSR